MLNQPKKDFKKGSKMILTQIFYDVDNFCKDFKKHLDVYSIPADLSALIKREKKRMSLSDIMTILVYFHHSGYRTFKKYYKECGDLNGAFDGVLSYNRFVELIPQALMPLTIFMNLCCKNKCSGFGFIDSTKLQVCHNLRISRNKVFAGIASRGKTSTGWFYGFKLHLIINERGEIVSFMLTPGNVADNNASVVTKLARKCFGKLWGDRGYISKNLFEKLFENGIKLITRLKKNMKNKIMEMEDKIGLSKRGIIESVNCILKETCQIEHSRHRSPTNFAVNLISGLVAYCFLPKKPALRGEFMLNLPACC
jgi:hypothetical protein